jgi:hypothetical protein
LCDAAYTTGAACVSCMMAACRMSTRTPLGPRRRVWIPMGSSSGHHLDRTGSSRPALGPRTQQHWSSLQPLAASRGPRTRQQWSRYEEDMDQRLDVSVKQIVQQNKRAALELQLHVDESTLLQAENKALQEERKALRQARILNGMAWPNLQPHSCSAPGCAHSSAAPALGCRAQQRRWHMCAVSAHAELHWHTLSCALHPAL